MKKNTNIYNLITNDKRDYNAIIINNEITKFSDLISKIDLAAINFINLGIREKDVVLISTSNSLELIISFYGLLKIGAISYLVSNLFSEIKIIELSIKANAKLILTENKILSNTINIPIIYFKEGFNKIILKPNTSSTTTLDIEYDENQAICYLNTSGTSGEEKIVRLSSKNINHAVSSIKPYFNITENSVFLNVLPLYHCFPLFDALHFSLSNKIPLVLETHFNPNKMIENIKKYNVTFLIGVPYLFYTLFESNLFTYENLKSLTNVYCGGEKADVELINKYNSFFKNHNKELFLCEGYGLSETSGACAVNFDSSYKLSTIGKLFKGFNYYVLNNNTLSKKNSYGELLINSDSVMLGYLNEPSPFIFIEDKKYFKTGDYVYVDENEYITIIDRLKDIIIKKGDKISPNQILFEIKKLDFIDKAIIKEVKDIDYTKIKCILTLKYQKENYKEIINNHLEKTLGVLYKIDLFELNEKKSE